MTLLKQPGPLKSRTPFDKNCPGRIKNLTICITFFFDFRLGLNRLVIVQMLDYCAIQFTQYFILMLILG